MKTGVYSLLLILQLVLLVNNSLSHPIPGITEIEHAVSPQISASSSSLNNADATQLKEESRKNKKTNKKEKKKKNRGPPENPSELAMAKAREHRIRAGKSLGHAVKGPLQITGSGLKAGVTHLGRSVTKIYPDFNPFRVVEHVILSGVKFAGGIALSPVPVVLGPINAYKELRLARKEKKEGRRLKKEEEESGVNLTVEEKQVQSKMNRSAYQQFKADGRQKAKEKSGVQGKHVKWLKDTRGWVIKKKEDLGIPGFQLDEPLYKVQRSQRKYAGGGWKGGSSWGGPPASMSSGVQAGMTFG